MLAFIVTGKWLGEDRVDGNQGELTRQECHSGQ